MWKTLVQHVVLCRLSQTLMFVSNYRFQSVLWGSYTLIGSEGGHDLKRLVCKLKPVGQKRMLQTDRRCRDPSVRKVLAHRSKRQLDGRSTLKKGKWQQVRLKRGGPSWACGRPCVYIKCQEPWPKAGEERLFGQAFNCVLVLERHRLEAGSVRCPCNCLRKACCDWAFFSLKVRVLLVKGCVLYMDHHTSEP